MEKDWIKDLRTKMRDYDSPEPEGLWEDIAASLDRDGLSSGLSRKQHRGRVVKILSGFAAAVAVLLLGLFLWPAQESAPDVLSDASEQGKGTAVPEEIVSGTEFPGEDAAVDALAGDVMSGQGNPDAVSVSESAEDDIFVADVAGTDAVAGDLPAENVSSDSAVDTQSGKHSREGKAPIDVVKKEVLPEDLLADAGEVAGVDHIQQDNASAGAAGTGQEDMQEDNLQKYIEKYSWPTDAVPDMKGRLSAGDKRKSIISTDIFFSNLPGSADSRSGYESLFASPVSLQRDQVHEMITVSSPGEVTLFSDEKDLNTEVRHRQPVRAGVSFRYDLGRRWSIETGLTYTMLSSDIDAGSDFRRCLIERKLHYIGIPLNASYDFLQKKRWSMYATAGGMLEKCVSGREVAEYRTNGITSSTDTHEISVRELQWSVNAAVGAEFNFTPLVGIFAEPGASWFFDNGSQIETIYQDRPFNFNFRVGLRFSFH